MKLSVSESIMSRIILSEFQKVPKSLIPSTLPVAHSIVPVALKDLNPPTTQKNTRPFQKKKREWVGFLNSYEHSGAATKQNVHFLTMSKFVYVEPPSWADPLLSAKIL